MEPLIYVVVCEDRHCDDELIACATRARADLEVERVKASYAQSFAKNNDKWTEREITDRVRAAGWVRIVDSYDDGPRIRVEELKVKS